MTAKWMPVLSSSGTPSPAKAAGADKKVVFSAGPHAELQGELDIIPEQMRVLGALLTWPDGYFNQTLAPHNSEIKASREIIPLARFRLTTQDPQRTLRILTALELSLDTWKTALIEMRVDEGFDANEPSAQRIGKPDDVGAMTMDTLKAQVTALKRKVQVVLNNADFSIRRSRF